MKNTRCMDAALSHNGLCPASCCGPQNLAFLSKYSVPAFDRMNLLTGYILMKRADLPASFLACRAMVSICLFRIRTVCEFNEPRRCVPDTLVALSSRRYLLRYDRHDTPYVASRDKTEIVSAGSGFKQGFSICSKTWRTCCLVVPWIRVSAIDCSQRSRCWFCWRSYGSRVLSEHSLERNQLLALPCLCDEAYVAW